MRKLSNKTPQYMPPPTEIDLTRGVFNIRGIDIDAWTTENTLLTSLRSFISLANIGEDTSYRVTDVNCYLGDYVFDEALITMSKRANQTHKWYSNYVVSKIVLYTNSNVEQSLTQVVAEQLDAKCEIASTENLYIAHTGIFGIQVSNIGRKNIQVVFDNKAFAANRTIDEDAYPVLTPKSGALVLNGAVVQAFQGLQTFGQVPVHCNAMDGTYVLPSVSYFDKPAIMMLQFKGEYLKQARITVACDAIELNMWRVKNFGEAEIREIDNNQYRLDTTGGFTANVTFWKNQTEILYEFTETERT